MIIRRSRPALASAPRDHLRVLAARADALADLEATEGRPGYAAVAGNLARSLRAVADELSAVG